MKATTTRGGGDSNDGAIKIMKHYTLVNDNDREVIY